MLIIVVVVLVVVVMMAMKTISLTICNDDMNESSTKDDTTKTDDAKDDGTAVAPGLHTQSNESVLPAGAIAFARHSIALPDPSTSDVRFEADSGHRNAMTVLHVHDLV
eukprot:2052766-Rhodomonas_salina.2